MSDFLKRHGGLEGSVAWLLREDKLDHEIVAFLKEHDVSPTTSSLALERVKKRIAKTARRIIALGVALLVLSVALMWATPIKGVAMLGGLGVVFVAIGGYSLVLGRELRLPG